MAADLPSYYKTPKDKPLLGYWDIRGLGQPIRNLLHYVGVEYDEVLYFEGRQPDWGKDKPIQPTPFPNLPYFFDTNGIKLVQSSAIVRYIGRKHGLLGSTEQESAYVDMVMDEVEDWRSAVVGLAYNPDFPFQEVYNNNIVKHLDLFEKYAASLGGKWIAGSEKPTVADFLLYEMLDTNYYLVLENTTPAIDVFASRPNLGALKAKFEALEPIKAYFSSSAYKKRPFNYTPDAKWY
ncbi:mu class glutathione-s-transferase [Hyaloraphidium curvatum]|nr:mu class glutathione-s-transferase [Hyaloraphidium curvatum]